MSYTFNFGEQVISDRELIAIIEEDVSDFWIDYPALDNAMYFRLAKFTMHNVRYKATFYGEDHVFIQVDSPSFVPCGWFNTHKKRVS
jgi:hypothetical protein